MKAFRGSIVALVVVGLLALAWWAVRPQPDTSPAATTTAGAKKKKNPGMEVGPQLFPFEKANLVRVEVARTDGTIVLEERADGWWIAGQEHRAARTMVNRVKHQLHDLAARATVVEGDGDLALYGLGESAVRVTLTMRDASTVRFRAGDPNPSGVSFYVLREGDSIVYTVKKSAVDYYTLDLSDFRERRFATFDSKDVDALSADLPGGRRLSFQRQGERSWEMLEPERFAADDGEVRALLGRVAALKASRFVTDTPTPAELASWGLDRPRARIKVTISDAEAVTLLLGAVSPEKDGDRALAWMALDGESTVYLARDGLLDDYEAEPVTFRLKSFARIDVNEVAQVSASFAGAGDDAELSGTVTVRNEADAWLWDDGVPVSGSTPRRVATRAAGVQSDEFVTSTGQDARYGFDAPIVRLVLTARDGRTSTLLVGASAEPTTDPEGHERPRWYARTLEHPEVYIVDAGLVDVVKDLMREHRRKSDGDAADAARRERIEKERGG